MTTTSVLPRPAVPGGDVAAALVGLGETPEPDLEPFEPFGVDDPDTAHGGRPRRTPGPPIPGVLVTRVRPRATLHTKVRRVKLV